MKVIILQLGYIPWLGYFKLISQATFFNDLP